MVTLGYGVDWLNAFNANDSQLQFEVSRPVPKVKRVLQCFEDKISRMAFVPNERLPNKRLVVSSGATTG